VRRYFAFSTISNLFWQAIDLRPVLFNWPRALYYLSNPCHRRSWGLASLKKLPSSNLWGGSCRIWSVR
jgi:hypothetical protein